MEQEVKEPDLNYGGLYTYADYLKWTIEERFEIIKGKLFKMSPGPNTWHQIITGDLFNQLYNFLKGRQCWVFVAPFDVRLPRKSKADKDITTVVQPDVCVVCDPDKIDRKGCIGAPDIVVEVLSPGSNEKDIRNKYEVYEEAGVKEYWVVSPQDKTFFIYTLANGKFVPSRLMASGDIIHSNVLPGFTIDLSGLFALI